MNIQSAEFIKGIIGTDPILQEDIPHIAFVGRSNVGKSSVINSLLRRKELVKSSSKPGKTQQINFFLVNDERYFVDLPGYGYAKLPLKRREKLRKLILWYLISGEANIRKVILIIDAQIGLKEFDREMVDILTKHKVKFLVVANKADKLKQSERAKVEKNLKKELQEKSAIFYSAKKSKGKEVLFQMIFEKE